MPEEVRGVGSPGENTLEMGPLALVAQPALLYSDPALLRDWVKSLNDVFT